MSREEQPIRPSGGAAAGFLSAGIGCLAIAFMTVLSEASESIKQSLNWYEPSGPLTGKAITGVVLWLLVWGGLHLAWRKREINLQLIVIIAVVLIVTAFVCTFPPVFQLAE
jgi:hypothetical protein